jgi:hypothetical protein
MGAALLGFLRATRRSSQDLRDDTGSAVRLLASLFETHNRNLRTLATEIMLLDRGLGPEAEDASRYLPGYFQTSLKEVNILRENP